MTTETKQAEQSADLVVASNNEKSEKKPLQTIYLLRPDQSAYLKTVMRREVESKPDAYAYSHPILALTRTAAVKAAWARAKRIRDPKTWILDIGGHPYGTWDCPPDQYHALCPLLLPGDIFRDYRKASIGYCHCTFENYVSGECVHCVGAGIAVSVHSFYYLDKGLLWNWLKETGFTLIIVVHQFPEERGKLGCGEMTYVRSGDRVQCQLINTADKKGVLVDTYEHDSCDFLLKRNHIPFGGGSVVWHHDEQVGDHHMYSIKWVESKFSSPDITLAAALSQLDGNVELSFLNAAAKFQTVASLVEVESCTSWAGYLTFQGKTVTLTVPTAVLAEARVFISWRPRDANTYAALVNVVKASCFRHNLSDSVRQSAITVIPPLAFVMDLEQEVTQVSATHGKWWKRWLWHYFDLGLTDRMRAHSDAVRWEAPPTPNWKVGVGVAFGVVSFALLTYRLRARFGPALRGGVSGVFALFRVVPWKDLLLTISLLLRIRRAIPSLSLASLLLQVAQTPVDGDLLVAATGSFARLLLVVPRLLARRCNEVVSIGIAAAWEEIVKRLHPVLPLALTVLESAIAREQLATAFLRLISHQVLALLPLPAAICLHTAHNLVWQWSAYSPLPSPLYLGWVGVLISMVGALLYWLRRRANLRKSIEETYEATRAGTPLATTVSLDDVVRLNSTNYGTRVVASESGLMSGHQKAVLKMPVKEKPALVGSFLNPARLPVVVSSDLASQELAVTRCNRQHDFSKTPLALAITVRCGETYHVLHQLFDVIPCDYRTVDEFLDYVGRAGVDRCQAQLITKDFPPSSFLPIFRAKSYTIDMGEYQDCEPYLFEEWVRRYPKNKARVLREAFYHVQMHMMQAVDLKLTSFIKREKYMWSDLFGLDPTKLPRMINGTSPTYNVRFGPFFWKMSSLLMELNNQYYNGLEPSGHTLFTLNADYTYVLNSLRRVSNPTEVKCDNATILDWFYTVTGDDCLIVIAIQLRDQVFYISAMVDATKFDGNQSALVAMWEIAVYCRLGAPAQFIQDYMKRPFRGTTFSGLVFELLWQRASGSPNTTCGNSVTMGLLCSTALVRFANDLFASVKPTPEVCCKLLSASLNEVGQDIHCPLEAECNFHTAIVVAQDLYHLPWFAENEYCSGLWWIAQDLGFQGGSRVAPAFGVLIGRFLARQGWTIDAGDDHFAYLHGAMLSLRPYWNHVPIVRAIAIKTIEHCKRLDERIFYDRGESLPMPSVVQMYEASDETFEMVRLRYGVTKARVLELEEKVQSLAWPIALGDEFEPFAKDL